MFSRDNCSTLDCREKPISGLFDGKSYCLEHYNLLLFECFHSELSKWKSGDKPHSKLLSLLGRLAEEKWTVKNGLISKARIRDRGFNFERTDRGLTFEITRHPGAFKDCYVSTRVVQKWIIDIQDGVVEFISERPWTIEDPDL